MKQLIEEMRNGQVRVIETPDPKCGPREVLVRNWVSLISPGTERLLIEMGKKNLIGKALARKDLAALAYQKAKREGFKSVFHEVLARLDEPLPLGYSSAGDIIEVGGEVATFKPGDRVACAGFGIASHAEIIAVPEELCVPLSSFGGSGREISYEEGSFVMLGGIALQGIRTAQLTFGENVVIVGLGLIGLLTVQLARAYGCRVIGADIDSRKLQLAKELGCERALTIGVDDVVATVTDLTAGCGADSVILTASTSDNSPILLAEQISRRRGRIVLVGVSDPSLSRKAFWDKELLFTVSKSSGPSADGREHAPPYPLEFVRWTEARNLVEFIRLLAMGSLDVKKLITHRFSIDAALSAYETIVEGTEPSIGVLITYGSPVRTSVVRIRSVTKDESPKASQRHRMNVGMIGAGMFSKNILLPAIKRLDGVRFVGIAAKTGLSSKHVGEKFNFEYATTDYSKILQDDAIGSVIIATRHNLHARMVLDAVSAGKNVFVEKPLCLNRNELDSLVERLNETRGPHLVMVGFNRRFSSLGTQLKESFTGRTAPLQIQYRVNAGFLPPEHWSHLPNEGGGRIIGEVCHMVDFLQFLTGSKPEKIHASSIGGGAGRHQRHDNISLSVTFEDGSLGTIIYTALGSKGFSRERIEVFCDGAVGVLEDFRLLELIKRGRKTRRRLWSQDMGYRDEMNVYFHSPYEVCSRNFRDAVATTLATLGALESLQTGRLVSIPPTELEG